MKQYMEEITRLLSHLEEQDLPMIRKIYTIWKEGGGVEPPFFISPDFPSTGGKNQELPDGKSHPFRGKLSSFQ